MSRYNQHEEYLRKVLMGSLSSENPSKETYLKHYKNSNSYFNQYKIELLERYKDKSFTDFKGVHTIDNDYGQALEIVNSKKINFNLKDNEVERDLINDLKLVSGIGNKKEIALKDKGYDNLYKLQNHPKYSKKAGSLIDTINNQDFPDYFRLMKKSKEHNTMMCAGKVDVEHLRFMDIETLGLKNVPIILIGIAYIENNKLISKQYLQRHGHEESSIIEAYISNLEDDSVDVTYNGARFDIPFVKNRADYFGIKYDKHLHYDLLYFARKLYRERLENCRLQTVESYICGFERFNDVPGQFIPEYYKTYVDSQNIGPLVPIIRHNRLDIISLVDIFMRIYNDINF